MKFLHFEGRKPHLLSNTHGHVLTCLPFFLSPFLPPFFPSPGGDNQPPVIQNCPASLYYFTNSGGAQASWTAPTVTDSQDPNPRLLRQTHSPPQFFPLGTAAVTYVFVDRSNNAASCTFFVTVYGKSVG